MSEENINSQAEGINSDTLDEVTDEVVTEDTQEQNTEAKAKSKSNVPKILAEKNELKKRLAEAEARLENSEFNEDKVQAMIEKAVAASKHADLQANERNSFIDNYWEENLAAVEETLAEHPSLSYEQAAKIAGVVTFEQSNPNKFSMSGNTPATIKQKKTIKDISNEDLRDWVVAELQAMWLHNAR